MELNNNSLQLVIIIRTDDLKEVFFFFFTEVDRYISSSSCYENENSNFRNYDDEL